MSILREYTVDILHLQEQGQNEMHRVQGYATIATATSARSMPFVLHIRRKWYENLLWYISLRWLLQDPACNRISSKDRVSWCQRSCRKQLNISARMCLLPRRRKASLGQYGLVFSMSRLYGNWYELLRCTVRMWRIRLSFYEAELGIWCMLQYLPQPEQRQRMIYNS